MEYTNQLIHETSPYLLQHAHNPVNWYPWGNEALEKAKKENKPILVSIGYAACHWCHVMERESFEDKSTAAVMNENFINIKIDREERPDLDHIYMDAVQVMTGSGGWPLNVFLTPDMKPFYGGTYFPPKRAFNRPSWQEVLQGVILAFREKRNEIDSQAENLTQHLVQSNDFGIQKTSEEELFSPDRILESFQNIMRSADREWGGFGKAPKFPQTFSIQFLLRYTFLSKHETSLKEIKDSPLSGKSATGEVARSEEGEAALKQALLSLDKMMGGGIYDQLGGGFARYSTDNEWLAPHFEKMLYDNALLLSVISDAYQLTGNQRYREVIEETMEFVQRELMNGKGFYSSLDADSEGVEGKFYVWHLEEIEKLLGNDAGIFCDYYDVTNSGNWEEKNILRVKKPVEIFIAEKNKKAEEINKILIKGRKKLLEQRDKRVRPLLDDKIILGWNALMNTACSKAFAATGHEKYRQLAIDNMQFLLENFKDPGTSAMQHTWKNGRSKFPAFLDDYAFLIEALIHLQEITGDRNWLVTARSVTEHVIPAFSEPGTVFFFYTSVTQQDVIIRKKEVYDSALPSGNSVMAYNLYRLGILFDIDSWKQRSIDMVLSLGKAITSYPGSFGNWACLHAEITAGTREIAIVGENFSSVHSQVLGHYIPNRVLMASALPDPAFPLLAGKKVGRVPYIYLCSNYHCHPPVFSAIELISLINSAQMQ